MVIDGIFTWDEKNGWIMGLFSWDILQGLFSWDMGFETTIRYGDFYVDPLVNCYIANWTDHHHAIKNGKASISMGHNGPSIPWLCKKLPGRVTNKTWWCI